MPGCFQLSAQLIVLVTHHRQALNFCQLVSGFRFNFGHPFPMLLEIGVQLVVHFCQRGNIVPGRQQLTFRVLDVFFEHARVMLYSFKASWSAEPEAGVFDFI